MRIIASRNGGFMWICLMIKRRLSSSSLFFYFLNLNGKGGLDVLEGCCWSRAVEGLKKVGLGANSRSSCYGESWCFRSSAVIAHQVGVFEPNLLSRCFDERDLLTGIFKRPLSVGCIASEIKETFMEGNGSSHRSSSQQAANRNRGKAIVNSPQTIYDQEPSMVSEDDETSKDKEIDKLMASISLSFKRIYKPTNNNLRTSLNTSRANQDNSLRINKSAGYENQRIGNIAGARETVGSTVVQKYGIQCYKCKEFGHVARECQKPKRAKDDAYHREKMLLCIGSALYVYGITSRGSLDAADSGPIFDAEPLQKVSNDDHYNVFSIKSEHPDQSKYVHDKYPIGQDAHIVTIDSLDMSYNREEIDQNDDDNDLANERELLASLIEKLKCKIDESKNCNKLLETSNKVLVEKLKEAELARRNSMEYASQMEIECAKVRGDFLSYQMDSQKSSNKYTQTINDLNQKISKMKDKLSAHQETISILSQQKEAQIKLYKTREDKELDKVIALENNVKVLDNIVYKTGQSVQTMNMLNNKC
nr:hypothetical protein [Tanacetum cinerariifolium]